MDSQTHIEFAEQLLAMAGSHRGYAIASLFPQIDRYPHVFHRMYAHTVCKAQRLTQIGLRVLAEPSFLDNAHQFDIRRFREEQARFEDYLCARAVTLPGQNTERGDAALLAFVSHLYLDTFNQPTQPFAPLSVYCSGQWALWEKIGDFRLTLYTTPVIDQLRHELFTEKLWTQVDPFEPAVQIEAMLHRLCRFSLGHIHEVIVEPSMSIMGLAQRANHEVARCCDFLASFEDVLTKLHIHHLRDASNVAQHHSNIKPSHERIAVNAN